MVAELLRYSKKNMHQCTISQHWRRKGGLAPLHFEDFNKKSYFLSFELEKKNFTTFSPPRKILEKSPLFSPWKKSFRRP